MNIPRNAYYRDSRGLWFDDHGCEIGPDGYWTPRDIEPLPPLELVSELKEQEDE